MNPYIETPIDTMIWQVGKAFVAECLPNLLAMIALIMLAHLVELLCEQHREKDFLREEEERIRFKEIQN